MKKALILGISGQDGSYLSENLLRLGYEVHGSLRRHSVAENQDLFWNCSEIGRKALRSAGSEVQAARFQRKATSRIIDASPRVNRRQFSRAEEFRIKRCLATRRK